MTARLEELTPCFQGLIPATLFTCSASGVPNVAYLSHVEYVDPKHVALSFQFFNKSRRNVSENPRALVRIIHPDTKRGYDLDLRFVRSEDVGPLFESMRLRIEAIASFCGLKGIFRLLAADVYEVLEIRDAPEEPGDAPSDAAPREPRVLFSMNALQEFSEAIQRVCGLDTLLDAILEQLERHLGFQHSMILLAGEGEDQLVAMATRGYGGKGIGAEVGYGEGIIGMAAEARAPIRISGLLRQMLYAAAVLGESERGGLLLDSHRVPLPGLTNPQSLLAVPLIAGHEFLGVLFAESEEPYRFHEDDRACIVVLGSYIALAMHSTLLRARLSESQPQIAGGSPDPATAEPTREATASPTHHQIAFFQTAECILVDGEYLVRSMPAKIFWKLLQKRASEGRQEFTNRELRLDKSLALPSYKDNLETRLLLLRRRLAERCPDIRLVPLSRGRFALELDCTVELTTCD